MLRAGHGVTAGDVVRIGMLPTAVAFALFQQVAQVFEKICVSPAERAAAATSPAAANRIEQTLRDLAPAIAVGAAAFDAALTGDALRVRELGKQTWGKDDRRIFVRTLLDHARQSSSPNRIPALVDALTRAFPAFATLDQQMVQHALDHRSLDRATADLIVEVGAFDSTGNVESARRSVTSAKSRVTPDDLPTLQVRLGLHVLFRDAAPAMLEAARRVLPDLPEPKAALMDEAIVVASAACIHAVALDSQRLTSAYQATLPMYERRALAVFVSRQHADLAAAQPEQLDDLAASWARGLIACDPAFVALDLPALVDHLRGVTQDALGADRALARLTLLVGALDAPKLDPADEKVFDRAAAHLEDDLRAALGKMPWSNDKAG